MYDLRGTVCSVSTYQADDVLWAFGDGLRRLGYTIDGLGDVLGARATSAMSAEQFVPARRALATAGNEPVAVLARLFMAAQTQPIAWVTAALERCGVRLADLVRVGVLAVRSDKVSAPMAVWPHHESWFTVSDHLSMVTGKPVRSDHVLGVGGASTMLAQCALPTAAERTWDLGTGCGVQSLHAAQWSQEVVATDSSVRAARCASWSAALSGVPVQVRRGDLAGALAPDERFDRIVTNPPFVITPRAMGLETFEYRDAGRVGDGLFDELVRELPLRLTDGGVVQMLANWEVTIGQGWADRMQDRLAQASAETGVDLDFLVIQRDEQPVAQYAHMWLQDAGWVDHDRYCRWFEAWLDDFERRGVEAVGFGVVLLQRRRVGAVPTQLTAEWVGPLAPGVGAHTAVAWATVQEWQQCSPVQRGQWRLVRATDVRQESHYVPGEPDPELIVLRQGAGFGVSVHASTVVAAFVGACDGDLSVQQICGAVAHLLQVPTARVVGEVIAACEVLLSSGMLTRGQ